MVHNPNDEQGIDFEWPNLYSAQRQTSSKSLNGKPKPKPKLALNELLADHIFTVSGFFSPALCAEFIAKIEHEIQKSPAKYTVVPVFNPLYAYRDNIRISITDKNFASDLWHLTGLAKLLANFKLPGSTASKPKYPIGLHENIRLYKYAKGQRFGKHYDDFMFSNSGHRTEYTLLIYLNMDDTTTSSSSSNIALPIKESLLGLKNKDKDKIKDKIKDKTRDKKGKNKNSYVFREKTKNKISENSIDETSIGGKAVDEDINSCEHESLAGGETVFYNLKPKFELSVKPETGLLLLHKHGHDCLLHEGREVTSGSKYLLRTDLLF